MDTAMPRYRLEIDTFTPETLPMARLSLYMAELAKLLGEPERVHFVELAKGSAVLVANVEEPAVPKVFSRLLDVKKGIGDPVALKAEKCLDDLLAEDGAIGQLLDQQGAKVIEFPGRLRPKPLRFGPFREDGVLEGFVIRIGGKDESVPVWLRDGAIIHKCTASVEIARQIALYLLTERLIRLRGSGKWLREQDGSWELDRFDVRDFDVLDDTPLPVIIKKLQNVEGASWGDDPIADLHKLRRGESLN
jgi:hypothetical protein